MHTTKPGLSTERWRSSRLVPTTMFVDDVLIFDDADFELEIIEDFDMEEVDSQQSSSSQSSGTDVDTSEVTADDHTMDNHEEEGEDTRFVNIILSSIWYSSPQIVYHPSAGRHRTRLSPTAFPRHARSRQGQAQGEDMSATSGPP